MHAICKSLSMYQNIFETYALVSLHTFNVFFYASLLSYSMKNVSASACMSLFSSCAISLGMFIGM